MDDLSTGFARAEDGTRLYFQTGGTGPPLVCCNGVGVSTFWWTHIVGHFREQFQVVLWDYRGHGSSGAPLDVDRADLGIERSSRDLAAVLDHLELDPPAVLLGHSMGVQVILQFCELFPDRTRALIPMFGTFGRPLDTFLDYPGSRRFFEVIQRLARITGPAGAKALLPLYSSPLAFEISRRTGLVDRYYCARQDLEVYLEHLSQMDTRVFLRMVDAIKDHDMESFLPRVHVPTLIFAGENDLFTPLHRSRAMAAAIPDAEMMVLAEGSHAAIVEHPETINLRIDRFLEERL